MHLLIADDNPLSLQFLRDAAQQLGHSCAEAADGEAALRRAQAERFDVLLLDLRMPGLGGLAVLQQLRASARAASREARALATTAEPDAALRTTLQAADFDGVLAKPLDIAALQRALSPAGVAEPAAPYALPAAAEAMALLDDALALRNLGSADSMHALRRLFRLELEALPGEIAAALAHGDTAVLTERLHKLCASASFCGAPRLDQACRTLRRHIDGGGALSAQELRTLLDAAEATLQAL